MTGISPSGAGRGPLWIRIAAAVAVVFGLVTIWQGGAVLLGDEEAVRAAGSYVPFVLWFNALAGFAYVVAGIGLWLRRRWAAGLALVLAAATLAVFAAFGLHIALGGAYELRTVVALTLRSAIWVAIALLAYRLLWKTEGRPAA